MLIKNNKIIVRKCNERLLEDVLKKRGYEKFTVDGKALVIPFHVFNEKELFKDLTSVNVKFYAVPLNEDHHYLLITNNVKVLSTCNVLENNEENFEVENNFIKTVELIRLLSQQCENPKNCTYTSLLNELKIVVKNPNDDKLRIDLSKIGKYLSDNFDNFKEKERGLINVLNENCKKLGYNFTAEQGEEFLKTCVMHFVYENIVKAYNNANIVFWYHALPSSSRNQDILANS